MSDHPHILAPTAGAPPQACSSQRSKQVKALSCFTEPVSFISIPARFLLGNAIRGGSLNAQSPFGMARLRIEVAVITDRCGRKYLKPITGGA